MKRFWMSLGAIATFTSISIITELPVLANLQETGTILAQRVRRPQVKLQLTAAKKITQIDEKGQKKVTWKSIQDGAVVQPGDTLRYTLSSRNIGEVAAQNLVLNQPIPAQMRYILNSAKNNAGMKATYSIDNGKTFTENPMIEVKQADGKIIQKPAPAEIYTHVRWTVQQTLEPQTTLQANYEVTVR